MFMKKVLVSVLFTAGMIGAAAIPLTSAAHSAIELKMAPPAPRHEPVPAPRQGYIWAPGHWQWNAKRKNHHWKTGNWERARPGYAFQGPQWVERDGRWHYQARRWDSDGDGVPNRRDARPNNPERS